jgi:hypothetical protein
MVAKEKKTSFMKMTKKGDKEKGVGTCFLIVTSFVYIIFLRKEEGGKTPKMWICRWFFRVLSFLIFMF